MKKSMMFLGTVALVATALMVLPHTASAYRGNATVKGPNYSVERHDAMTEAFAKNDYDSWKALVGDRGVARKITKENFARFAEAHNLAMQGKTVEAAKIRVELGLGQGKGSGMGCGRGQIDNN